MALLDSPWYVSSVDYTAVTQWAAATLKVAGDIVRQLAAPALNAERVFVCYNSTGGVGVTAAVTEPTWPSTRGGLVTDNTVKWQEVTGQTAINGDLTNTPTWTALRTVTNAAVLGQVIKDTAGTVVLICTVAGTMSALASEPTWASYTTTGATTTDNGATWVTLKAITAGAAFTAWSAPSARVAVITQANWLQAAGTVYLRSTHAETQSTATLTIGCPIVGSSPFTPVKFISVNGAAVPPTAALAGASLSTTGANSIVDFGGVGNYFAYFYGLTLSAGSAANVASFGISNGGTTMAVWDTCTFTINNTGASTFQITATGSLIESRTAFYNCVWNFGSNAAQGIIGDGTPAARFNRTDIIGGSMTFGATKPTFLFGNATNITPPNLTVRACDLSAYTAGTLVSGIAQNTVTTLVDCKIAAGVTIQSAYASKAQVAETNVLRTDSAGTDYFHAKYNMWGSQVPETTIVRTGGSSDGVTGLAINLTTLPTSFNFFAPFSCFPLPVWNTSTGSTTITMYGTIKGALPNNTDIDIEVEYLGAANSPLGTVVNTNAATILTAAAPVTADSTSAWGATAAAYQTAHAYGTFTGVILAGNASPQQLWYMSSHSGSGTSGSDSTIFNGQADGATVTDNAGANQIVWKAMTRFSLSKTFTPGMQGALYVRVRGWLPSTTWYIDPLPVKSPSD